MGVTCTHAWRGETSCFFIIRVSDGFRSIFIGNARTGGFDMNTQFRAAEGAEHQAFACRHGAMQPPWGHARPCSRHGAPQHEAHQLAMAFQVAVSHSTTALSSAADINSAPSELNASTRTAAAWPPRSLVTIAPLPTSTMRMHVPAANATTGEVGWAATQRVSGRSCAAFPPGQISNASSRPFYAPSVLVVVVGAVEI
jgi:hypothetical protein